MAHVLTQITTVEAVTTAGRARGGRRDGDGDDADTGDTPALAVGHADPAGHQPVPRLAVGQTWPPGPGTRHGQPRPPGGRPPRRVPLLGRGTRAAPAGGSAALGARPARPGPPQPGAGGRHLALLCANPASGRALSVLGRSRLAGRVPLLAAGHRAAVRAPPLASRPRPRRARRPDAHDRRSHGELVLPPGAAAHAGPRDDVRQDRELRLSIERSAAHRLHAPALRPGHGRGPAAGRAPDHAGPGHHRGHG